METSRKNLRKLLETLSLKTVLFFVIFFESKSIFILNEKRSKFAKLHQQTVRLDYFLIQNIITRIEQILFFFCISNVSEESGRARSHFDYKFCFIIVIIVVLYDVRCCFVAYCLALFGRSGPWEWWATARVFWHVFYFYFIFLLSVGWSWGISLICGYVRGMCVRGLDWSYGFLELK